LLKSKNYLSITISNANSVIIENSIQRPLLITFDDGLESVYHYAIPCLDEYNFKATIFCVASFLGKASTWDVYRNSAHLSAEQVRTISDSGHEIGSHTLTHSNLTFINQSDLVRELRESKKILEDVTGKPVTSVSFPHGSWNERVWKTALDEGYTSASLYRGHFRSHEYQYPVCSAGRFDSEFELMKKIQISTFFSPSIAFSKIASQFAKGTPLWKYRHEYDVARSTIIDG
jgi:peptidoglycan/xylan/chitin deacetylase (PgdA/CDA1 family)